MLSLDLQPFADHDATGSAAAILLWHVSNAVTNSSLTIRFSRPDSFVKRLLSRTVSYPQSNLRLCYMRQETILSYQRLSSERGRGRSLACQVLTIACCLSALTVAATHAKAAAVTVPTPTPVSTSNPQVAANQGATCSGQLTNYINNTSIAALVAQSAGVTAAVAGFGAQAAALALEATAATGIVTDVLIPGIAADGVGVAASGAGLATQLGGLVTQGVALGAQIEASGLPSCDQEFTGTVTVDAGGVNVTGDSIFNNNLGVAGNLVTAGTVTVGGPSPGITIGAGQITGLGPIGAAAATTGDGNAIAIGNGANASTATSTAVGTNANASAVDTSAFGTNANASALDASAFGTNATATMARATAIGSGAAATAVDATATGAFSSATGAESTAIGEASSATMLNSTALGQFASAVGVDSSAIGQAASATALNASAIGQSASASGIASTAVGEMAQATMLNATAIGQLATAIGVNSSALGQASLASGANATATGMGAQATATNTTAYGTAANAMGTGSTAIGEAAFTPATNGTALGLNAHVNGANSVALGSNSVANAANAGTPSFTISQIGAEAIGVYAAASSVVSVGGGPGSAVPYRQITNVADGAITPTSTDAINGSQLYKSVTALNQEIVGVRREAREGIAGALALTAAPLPSAAGKTTYAANFGFFKDAAAFGGSFAHRLDTNLPLALTGGIAVSGKGTLGGRVGAVGEF